MSSRGAAEAGRVVREALQRPSRGVEHLDGDVRGHHAPVVPPLQDVEVQGIGVEADDRSDLLFDRRGFPPAPTLGLLVAGEELVPVRWDDEGIVGGAGVATASVPPRRVACRLAGSPPIAP